MFLHGYLEYQDENGNTKRITNPKGDYTLYIRDKVGIFNELPPNRMPRHSSAVCRTWPTATTTRAGTL